MHLDGGMKGVYISLVEVDYLILWSFLPQLIVNRELPQCGLQSKSLPFPGAQFPNLRPREVRIYECLSNPNMLSYIIGLK